MKQLRERLRFDDPSGKGLAALFDLHARIQDELKPDYLLIDSRTGVTELGGLTTTALADCVVCLLVPNQESVDGTLAIVEALKASKQPQGREPIRVVPVVTRVMGDMADEGQTAEGIKRLVKVAEGQPTGNKGKSKPFVLPHDSAFGATDRIVGGEQKASAFSPLHKAYLELFQQLFPQTQKEAEEVLHRLEAVAELRDQLTKPRRRRFDSHGAFAPWESASIEEGVVIKSQQSSKTLRYADLVCRGAGGEPLIIVEYIPETKESEVLEFWSAHSKARCVVLLRRKENATYTERKIYCRSDHWNDKLQHAERWEPPAPIEFAIHENPGNQSIAEILEALHRGNEDLVPGVIAHWRECTDFASDHGMKRRGRWRPDEARRILDGLAATEKIEVATRILRYAARNRSMRSDFDDDFEFRHGGGMSASMTEDELFAPLLWRLPVEAAFRYLSEAEHPGWSPCLAGHRLLAEDVMGLRYDPVRGALKDAESLAGQLPEEKDNSDDDDEIALHRIHRRLFRQGSPRVCDDPPPILMWDQQFREDRYWSGALEDVSDKAQDSARKLMGNVSQLRTWLRGRMSRDGLVTSGLLGHYDPPSGRIELYSAILDALAPSLGLQPRYLKSVVFIQLSVFAMAHQARDFDGQPGFGFAVSFPTSPFQIEIPAHITLAQYFAFRLIERLADINLMGALEKLSEKQPEPYGRWRKMRRIPVEQMRAALLRARLGEAALGLPGAEHE